MLGRQEQHRTASVPADLSQERWIDPSCELDRILVQELPVVHHMASAVGGRSGHAGGL